MNTVVAQQVPASHGKVKLIVWMVLGVVFFAGFVVLGTWQVYRYGVRSRMQHDMTTRVHAAPVPAPGPAQWARIDAGHLQYLQVSLRGHYLPGKQTLVRGTSKDGYGFWLLAPFETDRGFLVLVNRGYIPSGLPHTPAFGQVQQPAGDVSVTGLLRLSETGGGFLRPNKPKKGLWYSRDVAGIAASYALPAGKVAPYFVSADADTVSAGKRWPAAGLTKVHIYNESMGYAFTWYVLALGTLFGAGIIIRHERRVRDGPLD